MSREKHAMRATGSGNFRNTCANQTEVPKQFPVRPDQLCPGIKVAKTGMGDETAMANEVSIKLKWLLHYRK